MTGRAATEYRYEKLTWPEINDAVDLGKVCIVPCGAVEQHGPHLPLGSGPLRSADGPEQHRIRRAAGSERRRGQRVAVAVDRGAAEGKLLEIELVAKARGEGSQAQQGGGDDLGPDAIPGKYRDARSHARRSKASISRRRERR